MHQALLDKLCDGGMLDAAGKIDPIAILQFVKDLFAKYVSQEVVLAQFEALWVKVAAADWPKVPNVIEAIIKTLVHDSIVSVIKQYVPAKV